MTGEPSVFLRKSFSPTSFSSISWAPGDESGVPQEDLHSAFWKAMMEAGSAGSNPPRAQKDYLVENLNREFERKSRLQRDDALATEFIAALLQMEMLDG